MSLCILGEGIVRRLFSLFWIFIFLPLTCHASVLAQVKANRAFQPGERLTYRLSWEFIPVGTAVLEVLPKTVLDRVDVCHFLVTVKSNAVIDKIYKVRDRIEGFADADMSHSVLYKMKQHEGSCRRDITVTFDWENMRAQYSNSGKKRTPVSISPGTFDLVSLFYAFRLQELKENTELQAFVTDGKKLVIGRAQVFSEEKVRVAEHDYMTLLVEPDLKDAGGVFEHSENAKLRVWLTTDGRNIPVKVTCRAPVGHFIAELDSIEYR